MIIVVISLRHIVDGDAVFHQISVDVYVQFVVQLKCGIAAAEPLFVSVGFFVSELAVYSFGLDDFRTLQLHVQIIAQAKIVGAVIGRRFVNSCVVGIGGPKGFYTTADQ